MRNFEGKIFGNLNSQQKQSKQYRDLVTKKTFLVMQQVTNNYFEQRNVLKFNLATPSN